MSASTKLSTSVKALCYLASTHPNPKNSKDISLSIGTNASKLRKLLSMMNKSGIVESTQGKDGGFLLKKAPNKIDLQEIYCAIEDKKAFHLDVSAKTEEDNLSETFNDYFLGIFSDVQVEIENKMRSIDLATIMKNIGLKSSFK